MPANAQVLAPTREQAVGAPENALSSPALQREVSLEAVRKPLAEALGELAAQGAVALKLDPAQSAQLPKDCRVTMRVRALPLAKVLGSLANLYGGQWRAGEDASFTWLPLEAPLVLQARRLGGSEAMLAPGEMEAKTQRNAELAGQIFDSIDEARWRSPQGVPMPDVSPELRALLAQRAQEATANDVARVYTFYQKMLASGPSLRLGRSALTAPQLQTARIADRMPDEFGIRLMIGDRVVVPLFDALSSSAAGGAGAVHTGPDKEIEEMRRAEDARAQRLRDRLLHPDAP